MKSLREEKLKQTNGRDRMCRMEVKGKKKKTSRTWKENNGGGNEQESSGMKKKKKWDDLDF